MSSPAVERSVEIDAPARVVWDVFTDVERWPEWTASVTRIEALDGGELAVGKRFAIKQPRLPRLVWEVTEFGQRYEVRAERISDGVESCPRLLCNDARAFEADHNMTTALTLDRT